MARTVRRYTLTRQEQQLWELEGMEGWREALEACVEDDAREEGCRKYVVYDRHAIVVAKGEVSLLPQPEPIS